tara:strand:+ start:4013 stop:5533 length:1521 start_codon:yes stop_codon:yes gene_type:complete
MLTLDPILKEFYQGPIIDALNSQIEMVQLFQKSTLDWQGRRVIIPVHVSRNTGTDYLAEGATLPTAGSQDYVNLDVRAKYLYGRFELTGQAIATARTTANSFATYVQSEMDRLVTDVKVRANQAMFTGQGFAGFIWDRVNTGQNNTTTYNFSGDKAHMRSLQSRARSLATPVAPGNTDVLQVNVIRLDTYSSAYEGAGFVVASEKVGVAFPGLSARDDQINLTAMANPVGPGLGNLHMAGGGGVFPHTAALRANVPAVIQVTASGAHSVVGPNQTFTPRAAAANNISSKVTAEQMGLYGNLCSQTHFSVDRNLVLGGAAQTTTAKPEEGGNHELRAAAVETNCAVPVGAGAVVSAQINFERMQAMLDEIMIQGGDNPDCIYMHPIMRQKYAAALLWTANAGAVGGNITKDVNAAPGRGDPGFSGYAFAGIPVKVSRHCGKGLAIFLNTRVWTITELQSFGMADLDGNILSRVTGKDQWEGFIRWYYDLVCKEPDRNALLVGITFAA